jgi:Tfp pilus assembly protein PilF
MESALAADPNEALLHYNLACYLSVAGAKQRAIGQLAQALALDPECRGAIGNEPDFDPIRGDPEFQALIGVSV